MHSLFKVYINYNEEKQVIQRRKIQNKKQVLITMKKMGYSKYKVDMNY